MLIMFIHIMFQREHDLLKHLITDMRQKRYERSLLNQGYIFKRLNNNITKIVDNYYMDYLKEIEDGLYNENEVLIEEKLDSITHIPIPVQLNTSPDNSTYNTLILFGVIPGFVRLGIFKLMNKRRNKIA